MKFRFAVTIELPQAEQIYSDVTPEEVRLILEAIVGYGMRKIGHTPASMRINVEKMRTVKEVVNGKE